MKRLSELEAPPPLQRLVSSTSQVEIAKSGVRWQCGVARAIGINHLALDVGSLSEALEFWRALFPDLKLRSQSPRMAFIDLGDQFIALAQGASDPPERHRHIGLVVDDVQSALDAAREAGLELRGNTFPSAFTSFSRIVIVMFMFVLPMWRLTSMSCLSLTPTSVAKALATGVSNEARSWAACRLSSSLLR